MLLGSILWLLSLPLAKGNTIWDYAPDFSNDAIPPYPPVKNPDGSNITTDNWRSTKLYGWKGCTNHESNEITNAYNDFDTMVNVDGTWQNIDWKSKAATDFWGPSSGRFQVPDNTRTEIQQILAAAREVRFKWGFPEPPWMSWRYLWIEARCSDGKTGSGSSDPDNVCRDATPNNDGKCWNGWQPTGGNPNALQAFSDPSGKYSRITFCRNFFMLPSLQNAIDYGKSLDRAGKRDLDTWDNRARLFLHEVTHLDYFMNAGNGPKDKSPFVSDLEIYTSRKWEEAYGPTFTKILGKYRDNDPQWSGYFTQRNADSYAFIALARYVQKEIGIYPDLPNIGSRKPTAEPRDSRTHGEPAILSALNNSLVPREPGDAPGSHIFPGCPDKIGNSVNKGDELASISSQYAPKATAAPLADPECNINALSGIPNSVFSNVTSNPYNQFCQVVGQASQNELTWNVDASGNQKASNPRRNKKRTPPPSMMNFDSFNFELKWSPSSGNCNSNCSNAYYWITQSKCGAQGSMMTMMTAEASINAGCGTYSYKITGPNVPEPSGPPPTTVSAQYCYPADVFGDHGDIQGSFVEEYIAFACADSANKNFKAGDKINWNTTTNDVPYNFNIWWKDNCETDADNLNVYQPLPDDEDANCMKLMEGNYKNCKNGGIGGIISVGCLGYEFKASTAPPGQAS